MLIKYVVMYRTDTYSSQLNYDCYVNIVLEPDYLIQETPISCCLLQKPSIQEAGHTHCCR